MPGQSTMTAMDRIPSVQVSIADAHPGALRDVYLDRLQRLVRLRCRHEHELNARGVRLLDHAIFAVYYDCRSAGIEIEARDILQQAHFDIDGAAGREVAGPDRRA